MRHPRVLTPERSPLHAYGAEVRAQRSARNMSLNDLAELVPCHRSYLARVEVGDRHAARGVAERLDRALSANSVLIRLWQVADDFVRDQEEQRQVAELAGRDSTRLAELVSAGQLGEAAAVADAGARRLAVDYLGSAPAIMLRQAHDLRRAAVAALARFHHPDESTDATELLAAISRLSGVLAYAMLDLDDPAAAQQHATAAWRCAEAIGHHGLRAWVRGTQSLIARFAGDYATALDYIRDGERYATDGTGHVRLLCGRAQCYANMGDGSGARRALNAAHDAHASARPDDVDGLFTFSAAKLSYYSGSALIWLDRPADARRARDESTRAIHLWTTSAGGERSLDDEALAHVYLATAQLQLHELEAALVTLEPILGLPEDRRISWIGKRLTRVSDILTTAPYAAEPTAVETRKRIREYR